MRAGDADCVFIRTHDQPPRLRPFENRNSLRACGGDLGIIVVCGSGTDDTIRALNVFGAVTDMDLNALCHQFVRGDGGVHIGACDGHTLVSQNQTERTHGNAADADEMDMLARQQVFVQALADICHIDSSNSFVHTIIVRESRFYKRKLTRRQRLPGEAAQPADRRKAPDLGTGR